MTKDIINPKIKKEITKEINKVIPSEVRGHASSLREEFRKHVSTAIMTAFGLVIALVWKDVVTALIPSITAPSLLTKYPFLVQVYTAVIVTIVAVLGILIISKWAKTS